MDGVCAIKQQYLVPKEKLQINEDFAEDKSLNQEDINIGPPEKKKRLSNKEWKALKKQKGQNKSRKPAYRFFKEDNLCKTLFNGTNSTVKCPFEKCKFIHDVEKYLNDKPKDIGDKCYIYSTKGFCSRGITCRFAKCHLDDNFNNIRSEKFDENAPETSFNQINSELQAILRKRSYNFDLAKKVLSQIDSRKANKKNEQKDPSTEDSESNDPTTPENKPIGSTLDMDIIRERDCEKKKINFYEKICLSPLTTVGNLPFRRICKEYGADITCGEMACAVPLINGLSPEWALAKRHVSEDIFGVQICGNNPQLVSFACQVLRENCKIDFIDLNIGCPIELIYGQGAGSALIRRQNILEAMVKTCSTLLKDTPFTVKTRTGVYSNKNVAHELIPKLAEWGASAVTLHGRSREQRYTKNADWEYIENCASKVKSIPIYGNGDILSVDDYNKAREVAPSISGVLIARGALIKPWIFKEIKKQKNWDPSSSERFEMLQKYVNYGLEHWGSDTLGVENTRRFLLEWQSFLYRYVPYGLLERPPQKINERPDTYVGRDDLETLMASPKSSDWVKLSEMFLGPVPDGYNFVPKHKANSY